LTIEGEKIAEKNKARHDVEIVRMAKDKAKLVEQVNKATNDHALEE